MKIRLIELFGGIGACSSAMKRLGIDYEIVDYVEIDKYAVNSFNAIHGTNFEPQDIMNWDKDLKDIDLIMHGSPCQDFSLAGNNAGGDKGSGTRSSLMYETIRIVEKIKPRYVIWENVKNILSSKHRHNYNNYIRELENLGYRNYAQVLNAKHYGVPQNRERIFTVSIRKDVDTGFQFPQKQELKLRLKDMLEEDVDEKYFLSKKMIDGLILHNKRHEEKGNGFIWKPKDGEDIANCIRANGALNATDNTLKCIGKIDIKGADSIKRVYSSEGVASTITTMEGGNRQPKILIKNATEKGYLEANEGDGIYISNIDKKRGTVQKEMIPTLKTSPDIGTVVNVQEKLRIRKLTPKECWRLMGFSDEEFKKAQAVVSNTQLYKQAGNSIVVPVLETILDGLLDIEKEK